VLANSYLHFAILKLGGELFFIQQSTMVMDWVGLRVFFNFKSQLVVIIFKIDDSLKPSEFARY